MNETKTNLHAVGGFFDQKPELLLPLDIQFFSEPSADTPPADPPADTPPADTPPADTPPADTPPADTPPADPKSFSQEDVNAIAAKEAKKAQEAMLKKLGIEDFDNAKDGLAKFREWQDAQKSDAEKQTEAFNKAQADLDAARSEANGYKAEIAALKNDVDPESLNDVVTLASNLVSEDVTIDDAIKQVVEKYPHFKKSTLVDEGGEGDRKKPNFSAGAGNSDKQTEAEKWANAFNLKA